MPFNSTNNFGFDITDNPIIDSPFICNTNSGGISPPGIQEIITSESGIWLTTESGIVLTTEG